MRPTLHQLYCNPVLFTSALSEAGVENAQAKVMRIMDRLVEYYSMNRYHERLNKDRQWNHQQLVQIRTKDSKDSDPDTIRRYKKSIAEYNRTLVLTRAYLKRTGKKIEIKIAKWPDLPLEASQLKEKPDRIFLKKILSKRMKKNKPNTKVLG